MSLLLDALKKAAKDKQQATAPGGRDGVSDRPGDEPAAIEPDTGTEESLELTLDDDSTAPAVSARDSGPAASPEPDDETTELSLEEKEVRRASTTVSDEALQMLVYKTNRAHGRKQKAVWLSVALLSVLILAAGGYYFYDQMVKDVESLQRKHDIALRKVNAEVIKRKAPELIADLTNGDQPAKVDSTQPAPRPRAAASTPEQQTRKPESKAVSESAAPAINLQRGVQQDPVSELLNAGWLAYNKGDLTTAEQHYTSVMSRERDNRDALLGMAAIAVARDETESAVALYQRLVRLDPQDPVAVAALAGLQQQRYEGMDEQRLKQLLRIRPDAAPAHFALGNIRAQQQRWPEAQQHYFDAWQQQADNADYAFNVAVSLEHLGKPEQALGFYRRSLELARQGSHRFDAAAVRGRIQELQR